MRLRGEMRDTDATMGTRSDGGMTGNGDVSAHPRTLGDLRRSGYDRRSVKEEMRANLVALLASERPIFAGIIGYDDTVIPDIENAILAGHDI